jgi:hypothetical protein
MHLEIFRSRAVATNGREALRTTQLAMPKGIASQVYHYAPGYSASIANLNAVSLATDVVFKDDTAAQLEAMTPHMTGNISTGYTAAVTVGLAV